MFKQLRKQKQRGFTLVEVMVAMMIVALGLTALMVNIGGLVDNTAYLQRKTIAHWVALNELELQRIKNRTTYAILTAEKNGETKMLGQDWYWTIKPVKTANKGFLELRINVFDNAERDNSIISVTSYIDNYHVM